jgi:hypothetical protein
MWNKFRSFSEIGVKKRKVTLRIMERGNKLNVCDRICYGIFIFHKSMLTGIDFWLEVMTKVVMNDKFKYFGKFIDNINRSVIFH